MTTRSASMWTQATRATLLCLVFCVALPLQAANDAEHIKSEKHSFRLVRLVEGLENPWGMAFLPDGALLITERPGRLRMVQDGQLDPDPIGGLPEIEAGGQGGLMDIVLHPRFSENRQLYISYTAAKRRSKGTEVIRARLDGGRLQDVETIFTALPKQTGERHFGSRLLFLPDGTLLITLGDRGDRPSAQDLEQHPGSTIRLHDDGTVPKDNPFVGQQAARPEIYSYGHRNIQGIAWQPQADRLWAHEHGPMGGDELNLLRPGDNYGWPVITYGVNYVIGTHIGEGTEKEGLKQPIYHWIPSIAPSGLAFYTGESFPAWQGNLFVGSLRFSLLVRLELEKGEIRHEERMLEGQIGRIRDVRQGPDGYLYLLSDMPNGMLVRLEPE